MYNRILTLFESFLGASRNGVNIENGGQFQCDCPNCDNGYHKHNLEINISRSVWKCWSCQESGKLSTLIKKYGNERILKQYYEEIKNIRESKFYQRNFNETFVEDTPFELPECCERLNKNNINHKQAFDYLYKRGLDDNIIRKYRISCTTTNCKDYKMRGRIVIPSYDKFNQLNYWVGRLYTNNPKQTKYYIPYNIPKKDIIFNEYLINWDNEIRLVEGIFDAIVICNAIPIMGKVLKENFKLYQELIKKAKSIALLPDNDGINDWIYIYNSLNTGKLYGNIRICNPLFKDVSEAFEMEGKKGVCKILKSNLWVEN
jgi:ribosomal protein L37AE/L43A